MLGPTETLVAYYLGGGFVILLGWVACLPDRQLDRAGARRYLRWSTVAAVAGLLHPALALAARDIAGQVGIDLPDDDRLADRHAHTTTVVNVLALLSALPALALLALDLR